MKITIDLEDLVSEFITDGNYSAYGFEDSFVLKDEIKKAIVKRVAYQSFDDEIQKMRKQAKELFKITIAEKIEEIIQKQVERIIREDKFKYNSYDTEKTLAEYIKDRYVSMTSNAKVNLDKITKDIANESAQQLKDRYDLLFTSQLVSKLDKLGLLKEDAAKILLEERN